MGANEAVQVIRVDNPLGATTFTGEFVTVGDLEDVGGIFGFPALRDKISNLGISREIPESIYSSYYYFIFVLTILYSVKNY